MDVDVRPRGDQGHELGAGGGAPVNAGREPDPGGCRDAVPSGIGRRRETMEEMQGGGGGMTRTTSVMDMERRARPIPLADLTSSAPAGSVSLAQTTRKRRARRCVKPVIIKQFINDSFYLMKCS
jgi:hypothetical protein